MRTAPWLLLTALYVVQGLPFGFQASALGAYLRSEGVSLTHVGLAGALALPWSLKLLWAPWVDRWGSSRFGRRRSWIVPMQALLALACVAAALLPTHGGLGPLLGLVLAMNLFAATMDIAVDGLAVDVLRGRALGAGNAIQVVGYKTGMLIGGGLLVWASRWIGWHGLFGAMALLVLAVLAWTLSVPEPAAAAPRDAGATGAAPHASIRDVLRALGQALSAPGAGAALAVVATYKLGESLIDPMFAPLLVDRGFAREDVGLWVGTFGMAGSLVGSIGGGWLASTWPLPRALALAGAVRIVPLAAQLAVALLAAPPAALVVASTVLEHLCGGALTTVMFAFMMSRVDRRIGASHYTLFATAEVLGKAPLSLASGWLAERWGLPAVFSLGVALCLPWSALAWRLQRAPAFASDTPAA